MIKLNSLRCAYNDQIILNNFTLNIESHLSILGANGSGKSTLAKALCNLIKYEGSVCIDGVNIKEMPQKEIAKLLSYVPPKLEVYDPFISVEEFVLLGRFAHKKSFFDYSNKDKKLSITKFQ